MAVNATEVLYLTSGLFKAAPSKAILTDLVKFNGNIDGLAASLGTSPYAVNAFPFSNAEKAKTLAENLLGSTVADKAAAITALEGILNANGGNVGIAAAAGIRAILTDAAFADAKAQLENRVKVAAAYVDSNKGNEISTSILDAVTKDAATVTTAIESLTGNTGGNEAGVSRVLTSNQDIFTGTAGDDNFRAVAGANTGNQDQTTLNSSDIIDGAAGNDALIVNLVGGNYGGGARIKNIETLQIGTNDAVARTFDYNVNMGQNEITGVNTVRYDQINVGENLTVANITATSTTNTIPTLLWDNEAGSTAGTISATFRDSAVAGTTTAVKVQLDDVAALNTNAATGVLNIGAGVETLTITSQGTTANTLNNTANVDTLTNNVAADVISSGSLTKVILEGAQAIGRTAGVVAATGLTDRVAGNDLGITTAATASNLLSVGARVTEVDASTMTGSANVRFTAKNDNSDTNVTFKGGEAADYVEFERGAVNATGGKGNDTFAFITAAAGITNSGFGSTDTVAGGEGSDTIQIGLNGVGTYTLNTTEFNNKTGIDVLDVRGANNDIRVSSEVVAAADAGKFTIRTDKMVQTSATSTADVTGGSGAEAASTSIINLTALNQNQGIAVIGGSGSERVVVNNASLNAAVELDGGTNGGVAGRYDTLTVLDSAVLDSGDLANVKGFEALILAETVTGNSTFRVDVTEAFLLNNTAATNAVGTTIDDTTFRIGSAASSTGTALNAGDTVTIDISDLLNATRTALKASLVGRGIDVALGAATVNYVVDGAAATAAQIGFVTKADANRADAGVNAAAGAVVATGATLTASAAAFNTTTGANITGTVVTTANNDTINATVAQVAGSTINGLAGTDTLALTGVGLADLDAIQATFSNIETVTLGSPGTNLQVRGTQLGTAANNLIAAITGAAGVQTLTVDNTGGTASFANTALTGVEGLTFEGGGNLNVTVDAADLADVTTITFAANNQTLTLVDADSALNLSGKTLTAWGAAGADDITLGSAADTTANTLTIDGDAQFGAGVGGVTINGSANVNDTIVSTANFVATNLAALNSIEVITSGGNGVAITDTNAGVRTINGDAGANIITIAAASAAKTVNIGQGGSDTIQIDATGTASAAVTINGFQVGATASGGDVISLSYTAATAGFVNVAAATGGNITVGGGATVAAIANVIGLSNAALQVNGAFTNAAVTQVLTQAALTATSTNFYYVALDNGTDTAIYRFEFTDAGANGILNTAGEISNLQQVVVLTGVADVATLTAANFA